jgi:hypothetical protein
MVDRINSQSIWSRIGDKLFGSRSSVTGIKREVSSSSPVTQATAAMDIPSDTVSLTGQQNVANLAAEKPWYSHVGGFFVDVADVVWSGTKWVGQRIADAYNAILGLFEKAEETTAQVNAALATGDEEGAAQIAGDFLRDEIGVQNVDQLSPEQTLKLYNAAIENIRNIRNLLVTGQITLKDALSRVSEQDSIISSLKGISDDQKAAAVDVNTEVIETMVNSAPPEQIAESAGELIKVRTSIQNIAESINDAGLRAATLAKLAVFDNKIAAAITDKIGAKDQSENAQAFIADVSRLKAFNVTCNLTEEVMRMLSEARADQKNQDVIAAQNKGKEVHQQNMQDEKSLISKIEERSRSLAKLQRRMQQLAFADQADKQKIEADIIASLNRPHQVS